MYMCYVQLSAHSSVIDGQQLLHYDRDCIDQIRAKFARDKLNDDSWDLEVQRHDVP